VRCPQPLQTRRTTPCKKDEGLWPFLEYRCRVALLTVSGVCLLVQRDKWTDTKGLGDVGAGGQDFNGLTLYYLSTVLLFCPSALGKAHTQASRRFQLL
jgi:hypothetical protein